MFFELIIKEQVAEITLKMKKNRKHEVTGRNFYKVQISYLHYLVKEGSTIPLEKV